MKDQSKIDPKLHHWVIAARPKTLLASFPAVLFAFSYTFFYITIFTPVEPPFYHLFLIAIFAWISIIFMQIGANMTNDYFDFKRGIDEGRKASGNQFGPNRVLASALVSKPQIKKAIITVYILSFVFVIPLVSVNPIVVLGSFFIGVYFSYAYTGGRYPLSYYGLGELLAFVFFGPIAVYTLIYIFFHAYDIAFFETKESNGLIASHAISIGMFMSAMMLVNNIRDYQNDKKNGKITIVAWLGEKLARIFYLFLITGGFLLPIYSLYGHPLTQFGLFYIPFCLWWFIKCFRGGLLLKEKKLK